MLGPGTSLILFIVGGVGAVAYFTTWDVAKEVGPKITAADLLPAPPPYPPLPRFLYKPEVMESLRKR